MPSKDPRRINPGKEAAIEAEIAKLEKKLADNRKNRYLKCYACKKRTKVKGLTLMIRMHYVEPYGCTGGDYHTESGFAFECPKCEAINDAGVKGEYWTIKGYRPEVHELRDYFAGEKRYYKTPGCVSFAWENLSPA